MVPDGELLEDCDPDVSAAFTAALSGLPVEHRPLPALDEAQRLMDEHGTLVAADAWRRYGHLCGGAWRDAVDPLVLRRLRPPTGEAVLRAERERLRARLTRELAGAVLAFPTIRDPVPGVAPLKADLDRAEAVNRRLLRSTMLASYLDLPGIALPGGVLLSLPSGADDRLLSVATTFEKRRCP